MLVSMWVLLSVLRIVLKTFRKLMLIARDSELLPSKVTLSKLTGTSTVIFPKETLAGFLHEVLRFNFQRKAVEAMKSQYWVPGIRKVESNMPNNTSVNEKRSDEEI